MRDLRHLAPLGGNDPDPGDDDLSAAVPGKRPEITVRIQVVCSADHGQTFGQPVDLGQGTMEISLPGDTTNAIALPTVAADTRRGILYDAFVAREPDTNATTIQLTSSRDHGRTWSQPRSIVASQEDVYYFQPQLAVRTNGQVGLSAYQLQNNRAGVVLFTGRMRPGPVQFGPPQQISQQTFDPALGSRPGGKHGLWWIGDYQGLAATPKGFMPFGTIVALLTSKSTVIPPARLTTSANYAFLRACKTTEAIAPAALWLYKFVRLSRVRSGNF